MKAEIIAVGTEVLIGQVINSNAAEISETLNDLGIDVYFHTTVGDNEERMRQSIQQAEKRVDLIILCGGLGPTEDDITRQVLADHLDETLVIDPVGYEELQKFFADRGQAYTKNNDLQVLTMENGTVLANETGSAVGTFIEKNGKCYAVLPGPPRELRPMLKNQLAPILAKYAQNDGKLFTRVLRFYGIGESQLVTKLAKMIHTQEDPTIAPYAKPAEVTLRIGTKAQSEEEANVKLDKCEKEILATENVGDFFYGYGDENSLVNVVVELLKEKKRTITAAESLTAGLLQATLGNVPGVSQVFKGGFVTYSIETKAEFLGLSRKELVKNGVVSRFTAQKMARQAQEKAKADYALSFTGVAGPEQEEGKEIGTVFIGLAKPDKTVEVKESRFTRDRQYVRLSAVMQGLDLVRRALLAENS